MSDYIYDIETYPQRVHIGDETLLYTAPQTRKPLTEEEIAALRHLIDWTAEWSYGEFARAIERAHGIGGE